MLRSKDVKDTHKASKNWSFYAEIVKFGLILTHLILFGGKIFGGKLPSPSPPPPPAPPLFINLLTKNINVILVHFWWHFEWVHLDMMQHIKRGTLQKSILRFLFDVHIKLFLSSKITPQSSKLIKALFPFMSSHKNQTNKQYIYSLIKVRNKCMDMTSKFKLCKAT